jgi:AraC-like DNA-binding protein
LEQAAPTDEMGNTVSLAIGELIREGHTSLTRLAKRLGSTPRTLQRQLKERQLDYKKLLDDIRRRLAINYLWDGTHTVTDIAFLLGYSETSAFNRAFKRWTGMTPRAYRDRIGGGGASTPAAD